MSYCSTLWYERRLAAFDLETTGTDTREARIVTATLALVGGGRPNMVHSWLVDPGVPIPAEASAVHGITTERAQAEGEPARQAVRSISTALELVLCEGLPVVAFNANYDLSLLEAELGRYGLANPYLAGARVVDPLVIDRALDKYRPGSRKLADVCAHYKVTLGNAHDATADALAAARLAYILARKHDLLDLDELQKRQRVWYHSWAVGFAEHLRKQGKPADDLDPEGWPFRRPPLREAVA